MAIHPTKWRSVFKDVNTEDLFTKCRESEEEVTNARLLVVEG